MVRVWRSLQAEWRCKAISLNCDLLTVYDIYPHLGLGLANTIQVVNSSIIVFCILNDIDSSGITLYYIIKVFPAPRRLVFIYSTPWYIQCSIGKSVQAKNVVIYKKWILYQGNNSEKIYSIENLIANFSYAVANINGGKARATTEYIKY